MTSTEPLSTESTVATGYDATTDGGATPVTAHVYALDGNGENHTGSYATATVWIVPDDCDTVGELLPIADEIGGNVYAVAEQLFLQRIDLDELEGHGTLIVDTVHSTAMPCDGPNVEAALRKRAVALALDAAGSRFGQNIFAVDTLDVELARGLGLEPFAGLWYADSRLKVVDEAIARTVNRCGHGVAV